MNVNQLSNTNIMVATSGQNKSTVMPTKSEHVGIIPRGTLDLSKVQFQIEKQTGIAHGIEDFQRLIVEPEKVLEESRADYELFLEQAQTIVDKLESIDSSNAMTIRFGISGIAIEYPSDYPEKYSYSQVENIQTDRKRIADWIDRNKEGIKEIQNKGASHAFSQAYIDYRNETGYDRDVAVVAGKLNEYTIMVSRYAYNSQGINPMSHSEVKEKYGAPCFTLPGVQKPYSFDHDAYEKAQMAFSDDRYPASGSGNLVNVSA